MKTVFKTLIPIFCALLMLCTQASASQPWPSKIKLGLIPTEGGADIQTRFKPLVDHLEANLGRCWSGPCLP